MAASDILPHHLHTVLPHVNLMVHQNRVMVPHQSPVMDLLHAQFMVLHLLMLSALNSVTPLQDIK